jgi:hypothetical protein
MSAERTKQEQKHKLVRDESKDSGNFVLASMTEVSHHSEETHRERKFKAPFWRILLAVILFVGGLSLCIAALAIMELVMGIVGVIMVIPGGEW